MTTIIEENEAKLCDEVLMRFRRGDNTADIARHLLMREAEVARLLWAAREKQRRKANGA